MYAKYKDRTSPSEAAQDGIYAHEIAAQIIADQPIQLHMISKDILDYASVYAFAHQDVLSERNTPLQRGAERPLDAGKVTAGVCDSFILSFVDEGYVLDVFDFKYGFTIVEPKNNYQLIIYANALLRDFKVPVSTGGIETKINLHVVQPRAYHTQGVHRIWSLNGSQLAEEIARIIEITEKVVAGERIYRSGPHCKNCPGRHACPTALKSGMALYEASTEETPKEPTPEELSERLNIVTRAYKQLECLKAGLESELTTCIKDGVAVSGWSLKPGRGATIWRFPPEEIIKMGELLDVDLKKPIAAITPNQAKKMGVIPSVLDRLTKKTPPKLKLVQETLDNKPKEIFKNAG
jgi:hypothetical protein